MCEHFETIRSQGYRSHMEDAHIMQATELAGHSLVGILDGHVGKQAADEGWYAYYLLIFGCALLILFSPASQQFLAFIQATDEWRAYAAMTAQDSSEAVDTLSLALVSAFLNMDANIRAKGIVAGESIGCLVD